MDIKDINISYNDFDKILNYFKNQNYQYADKINKDVILNVTKLFPNLNAKDSEILYLFSLNLVEKIANYFYFKNTDEYFDQLKQNEGRDIKGIILLLLPFIDDKNNGKLLKDMVDLNQFIYAKLTNKIPDLTDIDRNDILKTDFKFSNMGIGLLDTNKTSTMLDLFEEDGKMKIIYKIIHHNYLGILKTLEVMNGKYYLNWINVVPILLSEYKTSELYTKTNDGLTKLSGILSSRNSIVDFKKDYYGLYIGDIYNVIRIKLYDEIKQIKWLIFTINYKSNKMYYLQYLNVKNNMSMFIKNNSYEEMDDSNKTNFNKFIFSESKLIGNGEEEFNVWINIILFLCNNYSKKLIINNTKNYKKFLIEKTPSQSDFAQDDKEEDYTETVREQISKITPSDVTGFIEDIEIKHIWNFFNETLNLLKSTYLRDYLFVNDEVSETYNFPGYQNINFKYIYNLTKSLVHYEIPSKDSKKQWISFDQHFISFTELGQTIFFSRFLDVENYSKWLNLRNNIARDFPNGNYNSIMNSIYDEWKQIRLDLIFEILIKNGLLTKFETAPEITNKKNYLSSVPMNEQINKKMEKRMKSKKEWKSAYYYLTNEEFSKLKPIRYENSKTRQREDIEYFDIMVKDQSWYSFYAMDWLSQLNFFHHYINHRVLYVTGATGQGKSTQVPKLLMYALKAYEMKSNGKVVCTQPRIPPTTGNASRISEELGVPIFRKLKKGPEQEKTNNFYVQMKYSDDYHMKDNCPHLTLKITTDGTLYEELQKNAFLKEQVYTNGKKDYIYSMKNNYDIIIVDESHEHNTNMDMILSLMRQSCYYNNSVRLIVMSATMDEDEPVYRSYYRAINDNLVYPLKAPFTHPILNELCLPESIYMDRRFHISPPGETTQYVVTEYYSDELTLKNKSDQEASVITQDESYKKIIEICQKYPTGEILLFSTGMGEINKAVEKLNQILPSGNIALPYYSALHPNYKDIVEKIDKKIYTIKNRRERIHLEWGENYIEDNTVTEGSYKRAVLVATNVAEASITIKTLKFVVDNGFAKVNTFNTETRLTQLNVEKISEASRVQRKGRVGRTSDGTAYFLYPRGSREKILPKYKITQEDQSQMFLKLSADESKDGNLIIIQHDFNPNIIFDLNNLFYKTRITKIKSDDPFFSKNIYNILYEQYKIGNKIITIDNYWNKKYYTDKMLNNIGLIRTYSGFSFRALSDDKGEFYIIHPKEHLIKRNVNNEIIGFMNIETNKIPSEIFDKDMRTLESRLILVDKNFNPNEFIEKETDWVKTELYKRILEFRQKVNEMRFDDNDYLTVFAAIGLDCLNEIISIISMIKTIKTPTSLTTRSLIDSSDRKDKHKAKETTINFYNKWYSSESSDIFILLNIINSLKEQLDELFVFKLMKDQTLLKTFDHEINKYIEIFKKEMTNTEVPKKFENNVNLWNILKKLHSSGKLQKSNGKEEIKNFLINEKIKQNLKDNQLKLKLWCKNNFINYETIEIYITNLTEVYSNFITVERNLDVDLKEESPILWIKNIKSNFNKILKTGSITERIMKSFIIGRPNNYAIKIDFNNTYYHLNQPQIKGFIESNSYIPHQLSSNVLFYYEYNENSGNIFLNLTNNVTLDDFVKCNPHIFNKRIFKKIIPISKVSIINNRFKFEKYFLERSGSNYDLIVNYINNNSIGTSPWEDNNVSPVLTDYLKKLRNL